MRRLAALLPALAGALLLTIAAAQAPNSQLQTSNSQLQAPNSPLPHRLLLPALAADSAAGTSTFATPTPAPTGTPASTACGYRGPVRTLSDPAAAGVDRTPANGSIGGLLALDRPAGLGSASPRQPGPEAQAVALDAWLRAAIRTPGGGVELLISTSPDGPLLRASFPSPECAAGASPADRAAMEAARVAFLQACGVPTASQWRPLGGRAALSGIPAWGEPRPSGTDGAPSGIELAPVLSFALAGSADCDPAQPFGPTPTPTPGPVLELLVHVDPIRVSRGQQVTVTIIVQEPPGPGGTPVPGPAGIRCSYTAYDVALNELARGGPTPTGPGGRVSWTFTVPEWAALDTASRENGRVQPRCDGIPARGSARLEIVG